MSKASQVERESMFIQVDHPFCNGTGKVTREVRSVVAGREQYHRDHHTYHKVQGGEPVGEACDCKWTTKKVEADCVGCGGHGYQHMTILVPKPGDKVMVRDRALLENLMGEDAPTTPGTVSEVQTPDKHSLELPNGLAVQVSWDKLLKDGKISKKGATLWAFDISEVKVKT